MAIVIHTGPKSKLTPLPLVGTILLLLYESLSGITRLKSLLARVRHVVFALY